MNHELFKKKLEEEKQRLEEELKNIPPLMPGATWESTDEKADESEDYNNQSSVKESLEHELGDVERALEKITQGTYGTCQECGKEIEEERLMAYPAARTCIAHEK